MSISAADVNKLRQVTGAGMMDCKKALNESEGDFEKAIEILRKKGQKISANRADREAKEGAIFIAVSDDQSKAVLIELNCETDFVARNEDFQAMGDAFAQLSLKNDAEDIEALKALKFDGKTVEEAITAAVGKIGEKIDVSKYAKISGEKIVPYLHPGSRIGVVVAFEEVDDKEVQEVGRNVAMQIAAMNPIAVDQTGVPTDVIEKEIEIGKELARAEGKPENMLEKIAQGKLSKFYKDNTLLNQEFVKDTSKTVAQYIKDALGAKVKVIGFKRLQLGVQE